MPSYRDGYAPHSADAARAVQRTPPRSALVTGAASGVGRACALHLFKLGYQVFGVDVDKDGLVGLREEARSPRLEVIGCDLTDRMSLGELPTEVHVLVNAAGVLRLAPVEGYPDGLFDDVTRLMLEAPFLLARNSFGFMKDQGWGRIVNISSTMGQRVQALKTAYVASKWGMEGVTRVLAAEGAPYGVTANTLVLSHVLTPLLTRQIVDEAPEYGLDEQTYLREVLLAPLAIKELIPAHAVGPLLDLLTGPSSPYITGSSLVMDCGWTGVGHQLTLPV